MRHNTRIRVLVISDLFPNPPNPALGVFVERQTTHLQSHCDNVVVSPIRIFPHLRLWKQIRQPSDFRAEWQRWQAELAEIPNEWQINGVPIHYPRYTSLPRQVFQATWGFFAYPFLRKKLKYLHKEHSFDLIHAHYASTSGIIALLAERWMKVPIVLSIHGGDITYTAKQNPMSAAIMRFIFNRMDRILANSRWTAERIIRHGGAKDKIDLIYLGGNPPQDLSSPSQSLNKNHSTDPTTILSVGYLDERKGHAYVLRALKRLKAQGYQFRYLVVGNGYQQETLIDLTRSLQLQDHVSFEGLKTHDEVWPYFAECDIFVLPSWNEAFGLVYLEALSQGKPIIGCRGEGGPEELAALGDCIELVEARDIESLTRAIKYLLDHPMRRQEMGTIGKRVVEEHFTWPKTAEKTWQVYDQVLKTRK